MRKTIQTDFPMVLYLLQCFAKTDFGKLLVYIFREILLFCSALPIKMCLEVSKDALPILFPKFIEDDIIIVSSRSFITFMSFLYFNYQIPSSGVTPAGKFLFRQVKYHVYTA